MAPSRVSTEKMNGRLSLDKQAVSVMYIMYSCLFSPSSSHNYLLSTSD